MKDILPRLLEEATQFGSQQLLFGAVSRYKKIVASTVCLAGYGLHSLWTNFPVYIDQAETVIMNHPVLALISIAVALLVIAERYKPGRLSK